MDEYAHLLSNLCLDITKFLNPDAIILSGQVVENSQYIVKKIKQTIADKTREIPFISGSIIVGNLGEDAGLSGAMAMALQVIFDTRIA